MNGEESYVLSKALTASVLSGITSYEISDTGLLTFVTVDGQTLSYQFREPEDGVSVVSVDVDDNKHLVITYSDGRTETTSGIVPTVKGDKGDTGEDGKSFSIKAQYSTYEQLIAAHPTGSAGDAYFVGTDENPDLYVWLEDDNEWMNNGPIAGVKGDTGYSPTVDLERQSNGVKITVTNETGSESAIVYDGSGGGSSALTADVTSNLAVGAIPSGTTLPEGTTFTEFAQKLLISEIAPTIGFSISKSGNVLYGTSYTEKLTVNVTNIGTAKSIDTIAWYEGNTLLQTDTISSTTTGSWSYTMSTATTDSTTFKAIITYTKSDNNQTSSTKTASISFYYNKFYGAVNSLTPDEATVEALTTALGTSKGGTYSFTTSAARICYAYPSSLGALTSIKDGNGFSLFDSFTRTTQTYTQNGTSVSYYLYVLTDASSVSGYNVIFS